MSCLGKRKLNLVLCLILVVSLFVAAVRYTYDNSSLLLQPHLGHGAILNRTRVFTHPSKAQQPRELPGYISVTTLQPLRLHCDLCSIVSSSGQMLGQQAGRVIDQSACVWRMNNAPTAGFEVDVGTRTSVRVVSHTSIPLLQQRQQHYFGEANETVYVIWGPYRNMRRDGKGATYNELLQLARNYPHAKIYVTTEERMNYCDRVFKLETGKDRVLSGTYLSTGWFTLLLAMDVCHKIHIFGMINDTYCRAEGHKKVPYHYYEAGSRDECVEYAIHENALYGGHRFITEKAVFAKWAKNHNITFSHPASIYPDTAS
ncbi:alpha-N-acetylgalactosaminide alpha-2,6-sialyltransferase 3 [Carcharodon carcharias]|uniref:alpha-N-acetylgalactosaminide alpha-2,6-sialyltransferase 3 n=1 Tax=Carcharodon carcharias TaxID=13397 RepID=UPI001B7DEC9B|nr:alpha-N-acetylgalactosaminide alpha-2,6-sialyltransferase 3 [Carcharodon carcharias]